VPNAALRWKPRPQQIAPDIRSETLAAMNRRGDRSKGKGTDDEKAADDKTATSNSKSGAAASPGAAVGSSSADLATSGGTANGVKPEDWKARAEAHAQRKAKPGDAKNSASQAKKPAAAEHGPPGTPVAAKALAPKKEHFDTGYLWMADGNFVRPLRVKIIATDGTMTEVREIPRKDSPEPMLREDMEVVSGENVAGENDDTTNPFMPKLFRGGGGGRPK
jgi:hypothetical protein